MLLYSIYKSSGEGTIEIKNSFGDNSWINISSPSKEELEHISKQCNTPIEFLESPLDLEESARIEYDVDTKCTLIINDFPISDKNNASFITIPIGIILGTDYIITICSQPCFFLEDLIENNFNTNMRSQLALKVLLIISTLYNNNLKKLNKERIKIERNLRISVTKTQLYKLMEIEKSLVYFLTSLTANGDVIEKLLRTTSIKLYEDDKDLLEELIIENTQGIKTSELYTRILDSITDSYSSVISNEMNNIMKTLTLFTVFLTVPTLVFSFFGMNVSIPQTSWGETIVLSIIFIIWIALALWRRKIF